MVAGNAFKRPLPERAQALTHVAFRSQTTFSPSPPVRADIRLHRWMIRSGFMAYSSPERFTL